ncbi:Sterile alpha motif type 1 [Penicillium angulare]|uniref:Sterile alpha motif type 1 n=1 Tax=Penicillium angulare TaxID=116970 RepID=UPI0025412FE7|nr:Sterile alpha motif type 1 [Penicillium angulare]KAJ5280426.1 Sterile alpha motif type 1 [Penicillium angulare]
MLAKTQYSAGPLGVPTPVTAYHTSSARPGTATRLDGFGFASPTKSDFSEGQDELTTIRAWDEKKVVAWLHSIKCGHYESVFRANHFTGDNLVDCDQKILQEMGIKKVGDRVRIFIAIKQLRNKAIVNPRQKNINKLAALEAAALSTEPSRFSGFPTFGNRRMSQLAEEFGKSSPGVSPSDSDRWRKDYLNQPSSGSSGNGRNSSMANDGSSRGSNHPRNPSLDALTMGPLPPNSPVIRVIYTGGQTKVLDIRHCKTPDEVMVGVLKKLQLPEHQYRNYCFYVLDGLDPDLANCRRLAESELMEICEGVSKSERGRLILRKIHAGEPDDDELRRASQLAVDESSVTHQIALNKSSRRQQNKIQQLTGESWQVINTKQPVSPMGSRHRHTPSAEQDQMSPNDQRNPVAKLRSFFGQRPPSEMIIHELPSFFPSHDKQDIEKTMRRSQRLSRAASRLSVVSNYSIASSLKDAPPLPPLPSIPPIPPMPNIADAWLQHQGQGQGQGGIPAARARPVSVSKFNLPQASYRDSIASTTLQPLQEESPTTTEPNRKSYVSLDSGSDDAIPSPQSTTGESVSVATIDGDDDDDEDDDADTDGFNNRMSVMVAEDDDEEDPGLTDFLAGNNFAPANWMKGSLIGEGSFGSVFLALHAITGELMAVKQVEIPSATKGTEFDQRKNTMVTALKHEIELLQGMHHPNIVQYLGTAADDSHLNIFLEYVPGGSIATMLKQYNTFQEPLVKNFVRQILAGLSYLHSKDIIHRDIKGANILVDNKGGVKISDFGISKRVEASHVLGSRASSGGGGHINRPSLQGSVYWMAPEVVRQTAHTKKADIWSLGCLVVEMFIGAHPFPDCSQLQAIFAIGSNKARPPAPEHVSQDAKEFLDMTFHLDYEQRPSADELLKCKFLAMPKLG